jgi:hypothetical protein
LIEGTDIYNSKFLYLLRRLPEEGSRLVGSHEFNLELLTEAIYNDAGYGRILLIYNGMTTLDLSRDAVVKYPRLSDISKLLQDLGVINTTV